jgi:hyaluronan synthase
LRHRYDIPEVTIRRSRLAVVATCLGFLIAAELVHHLDIIATHPEERVLMIIWMFTFTVSFIQLVLAWRDQPFTVTPLQQHRLDRMTVTVSIPVYNEDPELIDRALYALFQQTRLPQRVQVVDDGSAIDYSEIAGYWAVHRPASVGFSWIRQENRGKRHAQARTFTTDPADIFITLDSDTALERRAIEEGLKPFADRRIQSVAGLELAFNQNQNWLTRTNGTRQLAWQLSACAAQSRMGNVLVNRGTYALYRATVVRDNLESYLAEDFFGHTVRFGDDSLLTTFALGRGRAVQQTSAIQLTMYPENVDHHLRQWTRWMRSSTIRTFWRIRHLSLASYGWWMTVINLWMFFASTIASAIAIAMWPVAGQFILDAVAAPVIWMYLSSLRNFIVMRSDETLADQIDSFMIVPIAFAWLLTVLKPLRFWGMSTCWNTGWGTRAKVEVGIAAPARAQPEADAEIA